MGKSIANKLIIMFAKDEFRTKVSIELYLHIHRVIENTTPTILDITVPVRILDRNQSLTRETKDVS